MNNYSCNTTQIPEDRFCFDSMAVKGNREWLQRSLAQAVGWDADMIQGIADAIATADTREEVDELLQVCR